VVTLPCENLLYWSETSKILVIYIRCGHTLGGCDVLIILLLFLSGGACCRGGCSSVVGTNNYNSKWRNIVLHVACLLVDHTSTNTHTHTHIHINRVVETLHHHGTVWMYNHSKKVMWPLSFVNSTKKLDIASKPNSNITFIPTTIYIACLGSAVYKDVKMNLSTSFNNINQSSSSSLINYIQKLCITVQWRRRLRHLLMHKHIH